MGSKEYTRLSTFLLPPANLPAISTLEQFTGLFPSTHRESPQIELIYRELQHQRALITDQVKENVAAEAKKGLKQTREMTRARRRAERDQTVRDEDEAKDFRAEIELFGSSSNLPTAKPHTLRSILPEMESACEDIEQEIEELQAEMERLSQEMQSTVGALSDLKYGRLARTNDASERVKTDTIESLQGLQSVCDDVTGG